MLKIFLIFVFLLVGCAHLHSLKKQELTFSNTQKWFDYANKVLNRESFVLEMNEEELRIIQGPPTGDSQEVSIEIQQLNKLQSQRTPEDLKRIIEEFGFCGWNMAGYRLGMNPEQDDVIIRMLYDASKIGFKLKKKYDRVRPSFLNHDLVPGIEVPQHASYPSNHSLESHFLALILSDLYPGLKEELWKSANSIAYDREIAGVHYSSDSLAGIKVAKLAFEKLSRIPYYQNFVLMHRKPFAPMNRDNLKISLLCNSLVKVNAPK